MRTIIMRIIIIMRHHAMMYLLQQIVLSIWEDARKANWWPLAPTEIPVLL